MKTFTAREFNHSSKLVDDLHAGEQLVVTARWKPAHSLEDGIRELIKGDRILKKSTYANV